ncbi:acyl-CoA dehydrogenase C-terminal domain-containing protein [Aquirhabdus parva]|uniref:3-methylmercaptopropionyl-CoA dehydrogenase n=1 Tax=Aquirhabdus parva TaxID=2283318 RepID=A0A345P430_9GAMM|nr:acyl-CoA dehydrogenase C-terminal domain-containing protein [Aquirhabdus parva]AXI02039.1 acyl-CoA dehydrogenase [Aquirhabdus parva]
MPIYNAPLQDMRFILNDVFKADEFWQATPELAHIDSETVSAILEQMAKFSQDVLLPLNRTGDEEGAKIENGAVSTPKGFKEAFTSYANDGWVGLGADEQWGGQGMPKMVSVMTDEMIFSANPSFMLYPLLSVGACMALNSYASQEQKELYLPKIYSGEWSGTMCLTEPHAGTDLGIIKTKAIPNEDGSYAISGTKIFITGGDHDLTQNIIHLVLAKTPDAPAGSRGISLFIVPKFLVNEDGSLGDRNPVGPGSIEHKMGIKASATCVMNFDSAKGYLVGKENEGLAAMFVMMNYERLSMGIQGLGASEASYQNAAQYATDRLQGRSATGVKSPEKPADSILVHPDVRRMLLKTKAHNEAARAFAMYVAQQLDMTKYSDAETKAKAADRVALLTPIAKAFLTDKAFEACVDSQMVFGGHGYIREWGVEQYVRDVRIAQIYEGTNGVQAQDLIGRKVTKNGGAFVATYLAEIREFAASMKAEWMKVSLLNSVNTLEALTTLVIAASKANADEPNAAAIDYLHVFGLVSYAYMFARIVEAASVKEGAFYQNKVELAKFFVTRILPELDARAKMVQSGSAVIMSFDQGYFTAQS